MRLLYQLYALQESYDLEDPQDLDHAQDPLAASNGIRDTHIFDVTLLRESAPSELQLGTMIGFRLQEGLNEG